MKSIYKTGDKVVGIPLTVAATSYCIMTFTLSKLLGILERRLRVANSSI